jgi:hypothetical protein
VSADAKCKLCGEPMPPGEEMFYYHGYSGDYPRPRGDFLVGGPCRKCGRSHGNVIGCPNEPAPTTPEPTSYTRKLEPSRPAEQVLINPPKVPGTAPPEDEGSRLVADMRDPESAPYRDHDGWKRNQAWADRLAALLVQKDAEIATLKTPWWREVYDEMARLRAELAKEREHAAKLRDALLLYEKSDHLVIKNQAELHEANAEVSRLRAVCERGAEAIYRGGSAARSKGLDFIADELRAEAEKGAGS